MTSIGSTLAHNRMSNDVSYALLTRALLLSLLVTTVGVSWAIVQLPPPQALAVAAGVVVTVFLSLAVMFFGYSMLPSLCIVASTLTLAWTKIRLTEFMALSDLLFIVACATLSVHSARSFRRMSEEFRKLFLGSGLLITGASIASLFSEDITSSLIRLFSLIVAAFVIPLIIALWNPTLFRIRLICWAWVVSVAASALNGLLFGPTEGISSTRISGLATHPNNLALCCVLAFGPAIAFCCSGSIVLRTAAAVCALSLLGAVVMSGSRAGLIGISIVVLVILASVDSRAAVFSLLIGSLVALLVIQLDLVSLPEGNAVARLVDQQSTNSVEASNESREEQIEIALQQFQDRPFLGVGLQQARAGHSVYLQLISATGILGLVGFLFVGFRSALPIVFVKRHLYRRSSDPHLWLLLGMVASYIGFLGSEVVSNALWERFMWLPPAIIAALYFRVKEKSTNDSCEA